MIVFHPLEKEHIISIANILLLKLKKKIESNGFFVNFSDESKSKLSELGYSPEFGARPLRRVIENYIENPISLQIIGGDIKKSDSILVDVENDLIVVKRFN